MKKLIKEIKELTNKLNYSAGRLKDLRIIIKEDGLSVYSKEELKDLTKEISNLTLEIDKKQNQLFTQLEWLGK